MKGFEKMVEMIAEACKIALGAEWDNMTDDQKHNTIMSFISTAAQNT